MFQPCPTNAKKKTSVSVPSTYSERTSSGMAAATAPRAPRITARAIGAPAVMRRGVGGERGAASCPVRRAEQSGGPDEQHQDEEDEDADLGERAVQEEAAEGLDDADEQAAEQRARTRAEPAEDDDDERRDHEGVAGLGRHVEERHRHGPRGGHARAAETEGDGVDARDGNAHQRGA